jgi:hypothetical protein
MRYSGSCHCGKVKVDIEGELGAAIACNCSICSRKGALLWAVPRDKLRLLGPEDALGTYLFNKRAIAHRFCKSCGIHVYAEDAAPRASRAPMSTYAASKASTPLRCR